MGYYDQYIKGTIKEQYFREREVDNMITRFLDTFDGNFTPRDFQSLIHYLPQASASLRSSLVAESYFAMNRSYDPAPYDFIIRNYGTDLEVPFHQWFTEGDRYNRHSLLRIGGQCIGSMTIDMYDEQDIFGYIGPYHVQIVFEGPGGGYEINPTVPVYFNDITYSPLTIGYGMNLPSEGYNPKDKYIKMNRLVNFLDVSAYLHERAHSMIAEDPLEKMGRDKLNAMDSLFWIAIFEPNPRAVLNKVIELYGKAACQPLTGPEINAVIDNEMAAWTPVFREFNQIANICGLPRSTFDPLKAHTDNALGSYVHSMLEMGVEGRCVYSILNDLARTW